MCPRSRHLPYKICKIGFRYAQSLSYTAPSGSSSMRLLCNAYLALMVEIASPPSEAFPYASMSLCSIELGHIPSQKYDKTRFVNAPVLSHFFPLIDALLRLHQIGAAAPIATTFRLAKL